MQNLNEELINFNFKICLGIAYAMPTLLLGMTDVKKEIFLNLNKSDDSRDPPS